MSKVAVGTAGNKVKVCNSSTGYELQVYTDHSQPVNALKLINDTILVSASNEIILHDVIENLKKKSINSGTVYSLDLLDDGKLACGCDQFIKVYDLNQPVGLVSTFGASMG